MGGGGRGREGISYLKRGFRLRHNKLVRVRPLVDHGVRVEGER
jgi:hypothetical protein